MAIAKYRDVVQDAAGNAVVGATVTILDTGTATPSTIYEDDEVTPLANPLTTDAAGGFAFSIEAGEYDISVALTGFITVLQDRVLIGAAEGAAAVEIAAHEAALDPHTQYLTTIPAASLAYSAGGTTTITLTEVEELRYTTATGDTTFEFAGAPPSGTVGAITLELTNGGAHAVEWPLSVDWEGGTAPTLTAAGVDVLTFYTRDAGTTWFGFLAAADIR